MGDILVQRTLQPADGSSSTAPLRMSLASDEPLPDLSVQATSTAELPQVSLLRQAERGSTDAGLRVETAQGVLVIQGDSVLCPCPDCGSPLSIRLWLMVVDCWHCDTAVELSEEQREAIREALAQAAPAEASTTVAPATPAPSRSRRPAESRPRTAPAAPRQSASPRRQEDSLKPPRPFQLGPAWIISLLLHLLFILLLAMITLQSTDTWDAISITISTYVSTDDTEGGRIQEVDLRQELADDLPPEATQNMTEEEVREVMARADQDARELQLDPTPVTPLPSLSQVRNRLSGVPGSVPTFSARDPRLRAEIVQQEGGTLLTEAAVSRGLRWLAEHQNEDGSWSLTNYRYAGNPNNSGDAAGTSLALLPFLGAGQTHEYGIYKENVAKGLQWLIRNQRTNGDLRAGDNSNHGMYAHGQGTIVLVEALAMTGDEQFRDPAQRAIDFIVASQHDEGGWRYQPRQPGDTSVFGWQLMALQSARTPGTGLRVPDETLRLASYYLNTCSQDNGSKYTYLPQERSPKASMTAEALLCRMYLGWTDDDPRLRMGMKWLADEHPPHRTRSNLYYWYYATQMFHHIGGDPWEDWNTEMRDYLVNSQVKSGENAGSWEPGNFEHGSTGGRIFTTSFSVCILEVYYRHLPLFKQLELSGQE
ncbi:MAG: terpene cyclase/mutase family protein [Planctomycetales bacterium]|nr:terpene cyclase/mutase family protein [Planctomycetales bacterium]